MSRLLVEDLICSLEAHKQWKKKKKNVESIDQILQMKVLIKDEN